MPIIQLIVILVVIGVLLWAVNTWIPMDAKIKQILNAVVIIAVVIWLIYLFLGGFSGGPWIGPKHFAQSPLVACIT